MRRASCNPGSNREMVKRPDKSGELTTGRISGQPGVVLVQLIKAVRYCYIKQILNGT